MKKREVKGAQSCPPLNDPWTIQSMEFFFFFFSWNSPGQNTEVGSLSFLHGVFQTQGLNLALQADCLPAEPPGKPENIGAGSLSLLQGTFPTQESNLDLLHCRQIVYLLSHQGSPYHVINSQGSMEIMNSKLDICEDDMCQELC